MTNEITNEWPNNHHHVLTEKHVMNTQKNKFLTRVKLGFTTIGLGFTIILGGCATQENQQIIMANMQRLVSDQQAEAQFAKDLKSVEHNPAAVIALSLTHAYHKRPGVQKVETTRGYLSTLGDLALRVLPFVGGIGDHNKKSGNISAGRDVIVNSTKQDVNTAGQGIETGIKHDGNIHSDSQPTTTQAVFAPEGEEGGEGTVSDESGSVELQPAE